MVSELGEVVGDGGSGGDGSGGGLVCVKANLGT